RPGSGNSDGQCRGDEPAVTGRAEPFASDGHTREPPRFEIVVTAEIGDATRRDHTASDTQRQSVAEAPSHGADDHLLAEIRGALGIEEQAGGQGAAGHTGEPRRARPVFLAAFASRRTDGWGESSSEGGGRAQEGQAKDGGRNETKRRHGLEV